MSPQKLNEQQRARIGSNRDAFEAWARELIKRLQGQGNFDEFNDHRERDGVNWEAVKIIADTFEEAWIGVSLAVLDAEPMVRRLHRVLLVSATYLAPSNWYESLQTMRILDLVKRHLPLRYRDAMNQVLVKEP